MGLRAPQRGRGLRLGGAAAVAVATGVLAASALPPVRAAMAGRELPPDPWPWLAVEIPVGTVWSEETAFRGALAGLAGAAFGPGTGRLLQATAFGMSHIPDARATGESLAGTVLVTGVAGWLFALLAERSGSLLAPVLAHAAVNEAGALAALAIQRFPGMQW
jgi:membrane protease YdiL (CAAX protease family)